MARSQKWQETLTFGGRMPWAVGLVLALTLGASLFVAFGSRHAAPLFDLAALLPAEVWRGQVWRLVTWPFIEPSPLSLIFSCLFIYWFGCDLANDWGSGRFLRVFGAVVLFAAVGTCLVALVDHTAEGQRHIGAWASTAAMTVAWGLTFPDRVVRLYFFLPIRGYWLAWLTVALTVIYAIYSGWEGLLPELFAEGAILAWLFRSTLLARWAAARKSAAARSKAAKRARSAGYLRVVKSSDDEPPELPPELDARVRDLLSGRKPPGKGDAN